MTSLARLTARERREINLVAQAIHKRHLVPDSVRPQADDSPARALIRAASREVGLPTASTPPQPRRQPAAGDALEHGRAAYADALEACRLLNAGRVDEAQVIAARALGHRAALRVASRQLDQTARRHTGRYFRGELFSVREYLPRPDGDPGKDRPFRQWYFRLVLVWREDGSQLIVANTDQLQQVTGMDVGEDGWADLARWIHEHSNPEGLSRKGRPVADSGQLIFREREDGETPQLRAFVRDRYPGLLRALSCLRRAMVYGADVEPAELPEDRPRPGLNQPDWDDDRTVDDRELAWA